MPSSEVSYSGVLGHFGYSVVVCITWRYRVLIVWYMRVIDTGMIFVVLLYGFLGKAVEYLVWSYSLRRW